MQKAGKVVLALTCLFGPAVPVLAQPQTVTGEIVSYSCYLQNHKNVGQAGHVCAIGDVKWEGNPPGILTSEGKLYELAGPVLAGNNAQLIAHLGQTVTITGEVSVKEGTTFLNASDLTPSR